MMKQSKIDLSICIVNWNTSEKIRGCLESIYKYSENLCLEIIVVDNASSDDSVRMIKNNYPDVILIENAENIGFGRAHNIAIRRIQGRYVLILNPDMFLIHPIFRDMISFINSNSQVGVVGCKLVNNHGESQRSFYKYFPNHIISFINAPLPKQVIRFFLVHHARLDRTMQVAWIIGACMLFRREVLLQLNGFDERYYMFCEDVDICYRLKLNGLKAYCLCNLEMVHDHGASIKKQVKSYYSAILQRESVYRFMVTHNGMWIAGIPYRILWILVAIFRILIMSPFALFFICIFIKYKALFVKTYEKYIRIISWGVGLEKWVKQLIPK